MAGLDSYTKLLVHFNGEDNQVVYTAETGQTVTFTGATSLIDTAQSKFGGSSLFGSSADTASVPDSSDWDMGSGDFTIDFWVRQYELDGVNANILCGQANSTPSANTRQHQITITAAKKLQISLWNDSATRLDSASGGTTIAINTWYHIALVRYGNTATLYLDGAAETTLDLTGVTLQNGGSKFSFGAIGDYTSSRMKGWIDEFRISKGIARWTGNFTPPTAEYDAVTGGFLTTNKGWM
jgi:hypothetical protein